METKLLSKIINILVFVLVVCLVTVAFLWFIHTFNIFPLPSSIENIFWPEIEQETPNEIENKVMQLIDDSNFSNETEYSFLVLTPEKATELLKKIETADKYYWKVETTSAIGNSFRTQTHRIYKSNEKIRVDTEDEFTDTTTVFLDDMTVIKNNKTGEIRNVSGDTDFSYDNIVNIAALDYLLSDDEVVVEYVSVTSDNGGEYLYVEIPKTVINGKDKYFVSLKHGIVVTASSEVGENVVLEQKTLEFDSVSLISEDTFDITNLKEAE